MLFQNDITSSFFVLLFISLQLLTSIGYHVVTIDYRGTVLFWYFTLWFDKLRECLCKSVPVDFA